MDVQITIFLIINIAIGITTLVKLLDLSNLARPTSGAPKPSGIIFRRNKRKPITSSEEAEWFDEQERLKVKKEII